MLQDAILVVVEEGKKRWEQPQGSIIWVGLLRPTATQPLVRANVVRAAGSILGRKISFKGVQDKLWDVLAVLSFLGSFWFFFFLPLEIISHMRVFSQSPGPWCSHLACRSVAIIFISITQPSRSSIILSCLSGSLLEPLFCSNTWIRTHRVGYSLWNSSFSHQQCS